MRSAAATLSGVSLMVRALAPGSGAIRRAPEDHPQEVDRLLDVGVGQEERLDHLLLVLTPLGLRVGDDGQDAGVRHPVERVPRAVEGVQGLVERNVLEVEADALVLEGGVEDHVDTRRPGQRQVRFPEAGAAEDEAQGLLGFGAQVEAGEGLLAGPGLDVFERGRLSSSRAPNLDVLDRLLKLGRLGVEVEGEAVLVEGLLVEASARQAASHVRVLGGGAEPGAAEGLDVLRVVRVLLECLRVLQHRPVVVLDALRLLSGAEGRGRGAGERGQEGGEEDGASHPRITSTPAGTSKRNSSSESPLFSFTSSKRNWLRLPWRSSMRIERTRPEGSTST